jgi:hypothetical protein
MSEAAARGLSEGELEQLGCCVICGRHLLDKDKAGVTFYRVTVERAGWDRGAIERRVGMQMTLGGSATLARVFSPDRHLAKIFDGPHTSIVHETCAHEINSVLQLIKSPDAEDAA